MKFPEVEAEAWRSIAPEIREMQDLVLPEPEIACLDNGVTIHILDRGDADVNRMGVIVAGGDLEAGSRSRSTLAATLLREGTRRYPGSSSAEVMEFNGAWVDTASHAHFRSLHVYSLNRNFRDVVDAVADMVEAPEFDESSVGVFREKQARGLESDRKKVAYMASVAADRLFFGAAHPLAREEMPDAVRGISRESLMAFHGGMLSSRGIHLFLCGKITPEIRDAAVERFGAIDAPAPAPESVIAGASPAAPGASVHVDMPEALQSAVKMVIPAIPREHDDYEILRIAVTALGGYFGSRLNTNIREDKGLTYGINASLMGFDGCGLVNVSCQTDPANVSRVIDEVRHELVRIGSGDFSADELTRLRRFYMSSLAAVVDSPFSVADFLESHLIAGIPADYFDNQLKELEGLDGDRLADVARRYLDPDSLRIAVAGPAR